MWKILHYLFGVHFVVVEFGCDPHVRRVRWTPNGTPYVVICFEMIFFTDERNWRALTFDKDAFLSNLKPRPKIVAA